MSNTPPDLSSASVPVHSAPRASLSAPVSDRVDSIATPTAHKLAFRDPREAEARRPSVQFSVEQAESLLRGDSPKPVRSKGLSRRLSSPPPPSANESRVAFDTFNNQDATFQSITLPHKDPHYTYSRRSRTFLCGIDNNDYSDWALEWLLDELVDNGDEIVCLQVVDKDTKLYDEASLEEERYKVVAQKLLDRIKGKVKPDMSISMVLEFVVGKVQEEIQRMISIYEPACLIVGTRGKSLNGIQGLLPGSVSKYCLQNSPVPVIVVRSSSKRERAKKRRKEKAPSKNTYSSILERSGGRDTPMLNKVELGNSEEEAWEVAKAIGIPTEHSASTVLRRASADSRGAEDLHRVSSTRSDATSGRDSPSPTGPLSPDINVFDAQSPEPLEVDSPESSDDEADESRDSSPDDEMQSDLQPADALKIGTDAV